MHLGASFCVSVCVRACVCANCKVSNTVYMFLGCRTKSQAQAVKCKAFSQIRYSRDRDGGVD